MNANNPISSVTLQLDPMTMPTLQAPASQGVTDEAALLGLVELAAARIATIRPPVDSPSPATSPVTSNAPSASVEPRTGLPLERERRRRCHPSGRHS